MKFPDGASIPAGGYVTLSLGTDAHFQAVYGMYPDFDVTAGGPVPAMDGDVSVGSRFYAADTPLAQQAALPAPGSTSVSRCDDSEGTQATSGGNGVAGADETSENLGEIFQLLASASPGGPGDCLALCVPDGAGKARGDDGCGASCGACSGGLVCDPNQCITPAGPLALASVAFTLPPWLRPGRRARPLHRPRVVPGPPRRGAAGNQ